MINDIAKYVEDVSGNIYKMLDTHFLKLSPWKENEDRRIVEIDSNIYAKKMMEKYNHYINNFDFKKASICLIRLVKGFSKCDILENNYLDIEFLERDINIILNNYFNSHNVSKEGLTELLELVSIYDSAINFLSYRSNRYYKFNANDLKKQINAKIH